MKEIIARIKVLNRLRYLYLAMALSMSILILAMCIQEKEVITETRIIIVHAKEKVETKDIYSGYKTPANILKAVHNAECGLKTVCKVGRSGELGPFQILPLYWNSKKFCHDLDHNNFLDNIVCADRVLYANYLTHNQDWRWTLQFYNGGNENKDTAIDYADKIIKAL